jgi:hypothetical protein
MLTLGVAIAGIVLSGWLFWAAMPSRSGRAHWFIGTVWEPYIAVLLVCGLVVSLGFLALSIVGLVS